jgi:RluA family pseudouridine synthase
VDFRPTCKSLKTATQAAPSPVTNIAAYCFAELADLKPLRLRLLAFCNERGLRGTILLSTEGINVFVAGAAEAVEGLVEELRAIPGLADLSPKFSESAHQPFSRMLVRIKKEIIAFGVEGIRPGVRTSPKISARTLKQWLDEGRRVTLLDTRNDYEIQLGTFRGAIPAGIDHFRDFPGAVGKLPESLKNEPIVMFCTGGIRCEKAGPYMESQGFREIHQLDGGILKYFEEVGGSHYDGECFVFDQRVGVDPALRETDSSQCFRCLAPLTAKDQADPRYIAGQSCPNCFRSPAEQMLERIAVREAVIRRAVEPLPGSVAADNFRPVSIPPSHDGQPLLDVFCGIFPHGSREKWRTLFAENLILDASRQPVGEDHPARANERYLRKMPADIEPDVNVAIRILHEDQALIVIDKPAPLPIHPGGRFHRNTLQAILHTAYTPEKPRPAHRLDANTSGVAVFTRTRHFAKLVQPQFERGEVGKTYLARIHGHPADEEFLCEAPIAREPTIVGARDIDPAHGLPAKTAFHLLRRDSDGTSLVEARPLTGRTNQIRAHLWHLGFPIVGDPVYLPGCGLGATQTLHPADPPMCLHAQSLTLRHPVENVVIRLESPAPSWAEAR